jgi:acyl-CoA dehydrogenase
MLALRLSPPLQSAVTHSRGAAMSFEFSAKSKDLQKRLTAFMDEYIYPNEQRFHDEIAANRWSPTRIIEELKTDGRPPGS